MQDERKRILDMLSQGKLSTDDAMLLLEQLSDTPRETPRTPAPQRTGSPKMLRVRVLVTESGNDKPTNVSVNLPLQIARVAGILMSMLPESARDTMEYYGIDLGAIDWESTIDSLAETGGDIVNISHEDEDAQVVIRVYVE